MIKTSVVQNVALLVAAVAVGILGLEAFCAFFPQLLPEEARLRLHWSDVREGKDANDQVMVVADPSGFGIDQFHGELRRGDLDFAFTTDEKGFRNDSPSPEAADIVVVGDSMAFGYGVPDEATWSHRVATQLDAYTLRNFGLIGGAPQQYLRVLKSEALELNPKLVLFMLFPGNDLDDARVFKEWLEAHTDITYPEWRIAGERRPALERSAEAVAWKLVAFQRALRSSLLSRELGETITFGDGQQLQLAPAVYDGNARMADPVASRFPAVDDDDREGAEAFAKAGQPLPGSADADQGGGLSASSGQTGSGAHRELPAGARDAAHPLHRPDAVLPSSRARSARYSLRSTGIPTRVAIS